MTIDELKAKYKEDAEALQVISELEKKANTNYLQDNIKLKQENEKLKGDNALLYSQLMNGGKTEDTDNAPAFKDYSNDIVEALRNRKK